MWQRAALLHHPDLLRPAPGRARSGLRDRGLPVGLGDGRSERAHDLLDWGRPVTARDRIVIVGLAVIAMLAAGWLLVVSPERERAAKLATEIGSANGRLAAAEGQAAGARRAQASYGAAYASVVTLGKAVPPGQEVPSLIYQLAHASDQRNIDFSSITSGSGGSSGSSPSASPARSSIAGSETSTGFTQMPFTFVFNGSFFDLYRLFSQIDGFAKRTASGAVQVRGRLLTIQSGKPAPSPSAGGGPGAGSPAPDALTATVTATAYVLPSVQGLTAGATSSSPPGAGTATSVSSRRPTTSSPTAPALAGVPR